MWGGGGDRGTQSLAHIPFLSFEEILFPSRKLLSFEKESSFYSSASEHPFILYSLN